MRRVQNALREFGISVDQSQFIAMTEQISERVFEN